jgi:hypothetical protein
MAVSGSFCAQKRLFYGSFAPIHRALRGELSLKSPRKRPGEERNPHILFPRLPHLQSLQGLIFILTDISGNHRP